MSQTLLRILAWGSIVALFVVTDTTMALRPHTVISPDADRFIALVCIGTMFALAYPKHIVAILAVLILIIAGFETLQRLIAGRHGVIKDIIVKSAGCSAGVLFAMIARRLSIDGKSGEN